jgi:hypothetical protein
MGAPLINKGRIGSMKETMTDKETKNPLKIVSLEGIQMYQAIKYILNSP